MSIYDTNIHNPILSQDALLDVVDNENDSPHHFIPAKHPRPILIAGFKRAGKDTVARMLQQALISAGHTAEIMPFAKPMKQIAATVLGISLDQLDEYKNDPMVYKLVITNNHNKCDIHVTNCREFLQRLGNEAIKPIFGNHVWANLFNSRRSNSSADYIIVPDFRFLVEGTPDAITIRVTSNHTVNIDLHSSETELIDNQFIFDYYLDNDDYALTQSDIDNFVSNQLLKEHT